MSRSLQRTVAGRDVLVAFATVASLSLLARAVPLQPLQVPGYLLTVGYDLVETALPVLAPYWPVGYPAYLYVLAVAGAGIARWLRARGSPNAWRPAVAGAFTLLGVLALALAATVYLPHAGADPTPVAIVAATGVVFLVTAAVVAGVLRFRFETPA